MIPDRHSPGGTLPFIYEAKRLKIELTDVKITIKDPDKNVVVNAAVLTELGNGQYFYDYTVPTTEGYYSYRIDSASQPRLEAGIFLVGASDLAQEIDAYLSVRHGSKRWDRGGGSCTHEDVWEVSEKKRILDGIKELKTEIKALKSKAKKKQVDEDDVLSKTLKRIENILKINTDSVMDMQKDQTDLEAIIIEKASPLKLARMLDEHEA